MTEEEKRRKAMQTIGDLDKPFHRPECQCNDCEAWRVSKGREPANPAEYAARKVGKAIDEEIARQGKKVEGVEGSFSGGIGMCEGERPLATLTIETYPMSFSISFAWNPLVSMWSAETPGHGIMFDKSLKKLYKRVGKLLRLRDWGKE